MTVKRKMLNNRGSALVTVIICMLFIGIIAATVISIARSNLESSMTGMKSTENFYDGEESLDLIRSEIKKMADDAVNTAYIKWLTDYTDVIYGNDVIDEESYSAFTDYFWNELTAQLKTVFYVKEQTGTDEDGNPIFSTRIAPVPANGYEELLKRLHITPLGGLPGEGETLPEDLIPTVVRYIDGTIAIEGVKIQRTDTNNDLVTIATDMTLEIGELKVQIGANIGVNTNIANYALISDQTVVMADRYTDDPNFIAGGSTLSIIGDIYGGGKKAGSSPSDYSGNGIYTRGITAKLYSDNIVTRSTFMADEAAKVEMQGKMEAGQNAASGEYQTKLWANNVLMDGKTAGRMSVQGICNIADDLTINANGSKFELVGENSEYYGYNTTYDGTAASDSSSVIINGKNVKLDLSAAKKLYLAGKSYVYVPNTWLQQNGTGMTYLQGESISVRTLQAAYLLPGECIDGVGHNPMTEKEFISIKDPANADKVDRTKININNTNSAGMRLVSYLNPSEPCHVAKVTYQQNGSATHLYYLYMNFVTPNKAAEYMMTFSNYYEDVIMSRIRMANQNDDYSEIKLPAANRVYDSAKKMWHFERGNIVNTGNLLEIGYDPATNNPTYTLFENNVSINDKPFGEECGTIKKKYTFIYTSLSENTKAGDDTKDLTDLLEINFDSITGDLVEPIRNDKGEDIKFQVGSYDTDGSVGRTAAMIVSDKDIYLLSSGIAFGSRSAAIRPYPDAKGPAGIIISKGNVYVDSAAPTFWGTIIARGDILVAGSNKRVIAASTNVRQLLLSHKLVGSYFSKGGKTSNVTDLDGDSIISIDYTNWKKD